MGNKSKPILQWHPAFYAGIQIEFEAERDKLTFENEHQLGTKPKQIDVLIIKNNSNEPIQKILGESFESITLSNTRVLLNILRIFENTVSKNRKMVYTM